MWKINKDQAERIKAKVVDGITINRDYQIPYLAGYSKDGKTIFIDKSFPEKYKLDIYLIIHETIEKHFESTLPNERYQDAHHLATIVEHAVLVVDGIDVDKYEKLMNSWEKKSYNQQLINVPKNLDLQPYVDSKDLKVLKRIKKAGKNIIR